MKLSLALRYLKVHGLRLSARQLQLRLNKGEISGVKVGKGKWEIESSALVDYLAKGGGEAGKGIALLVRTSKGDKGGKRKKAELDAQEDKAMAFIAGNSERLFGMEVEGKVKVYRVECQVAKLFKSHKWGEVKKGIRAGRFRYLVVQSMDRLTRKEGMRERIIRVLGKYGVKLVVLDEALGLDTRSIQEIDEWDVLTDEVLKVGRTHPMFGEVMKRFRSRGEYRREDRRQEVRMEEFNEF